MELKIKEENKKVFNRIGLAMLVSMILVNVIQIIIFNIIRIAINGICHDNFFLFIPVF